MLMDYNFIYHLQIEFNIIVENRLIYIFILVLNSLLHQSHVVKELIGKEYLHLINKFSAAVS